MLPCGQDFESAVAEFDHVFSRIPPQVHTSQDKAASTCTLHSTSRGQVIRSFRPKNDAQSAALLHGGGGNALRNHISPI